MRLAEITRGFGVRVAAISAALILSSMVVLGLVVYSFIDDVLELDAAVRIEREASRLLAVARHSTIEALKAEVDPQRREDATGRFFYRIVGSDGGHIAGDQFLISAPAGWSKQIVRRRAGAPTGGALLIVLTTPIADGIDLSIGLDIQWIAYVEEELLDLLRWALLGGLALSVLTAYLILRLVAHRIDLVVASAHEIMEGNLKRRVPVTGARDDFDHLSETLNELLDRIQGLIGNIEQVTNDIAHDLRTPLGRLRQRLEQARTHASTTEDYARAVDGAIQEADGLLSTFTALLRIAQVEAGSRREHFRQIDLSEIIRSVFEAYEPAAEDTGHRLIARVADGMKLVADRDLIAQVFANLIENALTHTPEGSTITVSLDERADGITASVADNGPGVPADERERIFQRFYRLEHSRSSAGTGLGLSLVAAVAKLHGAQLNASDNHPGLRISLRFPFDAATSPA